MSQKILYISKKSTLAEKFAKTIESHFILERRSVTVKSLYRELVDVSVIVIYTTFFSEEETEELYSFLTIMPNEVIPVLLLGNPTDTRVFKNQLRYPISGEFDASTFSFSLEEELTRYIKKLAPVKKVVAAPVVRHSITIYNRDVNLLHRAKNVLSNDYEVAILDNARATIVYLSKQLPDLLILGYENARAAECEFLITQLKQAKLTANLPIMVYGEYMSNEQKDRFKQLQVVDILEDSDEPLTTKTKVDTFFASLRS